MKKYFVLFCLLMKALDNFSQAPSFTLANSTCENYTVYLTANNGSVAVTGYTWAVSPSGPAILTPASSSTGINFTSAGLYTVQLSVTNGTTVTVTTNTINVLPNPQVSISSFITGPICPPPTAIGILPLTANGANTYTWAPGSSTLTSINIHPPVSTTYTLTGTQVNGCVSSATLFVPVYPLPTLFASGPSGACNGSNVCLSAFGSLVIYSWSGPCGFSSISQNPCFIISSGCGGTYTVGGTDVNSCLNIVTVPIAVFAPPTLNISPTTTALCLGQTATLSLSGALNSQTWSTGATTSSILVSPTTNTNYFVNGTDANACSFSNNINLAVLPSPTVTAVSSSSIICAGSPATIIASGASTYSWNTSATTNSIVITPSVSTSYSVTGTNSLNCQNTSVYTQSVSLCTSVNSILEESIRLRIYPNPSNDQLTIESKGENKNLTIKIYNSFGDLVKEQNLAFENNKATVNTNELSNGFYFLQTQTNHGIAENRSKENFIRFSILK